MSRRPPRLPIREAFQLLELTDSMVVGHIRAGSSYEEKTALLHELVRSQRKALMRRYHPDVCEDELERCQQINEAADILLEYARVGPGQHPPPPQPRVVVFRTSSWGSSTTTSTGTGSWWSGWGFD